MANDFEVSIDVAAPADLTWELAGDPARIGEWFAAVDTVEMDGDMRIATMKNGARLVERLADRDDLGRAYSYEVVSGIPNLIRHRATISVEQLPDGSRVRWRQTVESEAEGYDAERRLSGVMRQGLESLRDQVEDGSHGSSR